MTRWKRLERDAARQAGTERLPNTGEHRSDFVAGPFAVEHKARKRLPRLLHDAMAQAVAAAAHGQTPLVVLCEARQGVKAVRYAVLRWQDWLEWHGPAEGTSEDDGQASA